MFPGPLSCSLSGAGLKKGIWEIETTNIRDFASDKHKTVDDTSYGHGAGMILKPDVVNSAMLKALEDFPNATNIIYLSPRGKRFSQKIAHSFAEGNGLIALCGRYEGVDNRVIEYWEKHHNLLEISLGDYVLSGGEVAALAVVDACVRLLPGIVNNEESILNESFELDLLEFPQYTKPYEWSGMTVPEVLLSGNHRKVSEWQREQAEKVTEDRRPDLWAAYLAGKR
jgi:tRNA (guanine37-N1)-methyltransferase